MDGMSSATPPLRLQGRGSFVAAARRVADLPGPRGWPIVGNTPQLKAGAPHASLEAWALRYGPLFRLHFGPYRAVGVAEPGLIEQLLRNRPEALRRSPRVSQLIEETGLSGVFSAEGEAWRRQRRLVMRALTPEVVRECFPTIATVTQRLCARWHAAVDRGGQPDVLRDLKCYSVDVTTWMTLGLDLDTLRHDSAGLQDDIDLWFRAIGRRLPLPLPYWRVFKLPFDRRADAALQRLKALIDRIIADTRQQMQHQPALRLRPRNIVQALVVARDQPDSGFSDEDVRGNVAVMLLAGEDTTANTLAWLLAHLAQAPQACTVARAEAREVLAGRPVLGDFADLDRLPQLEAATLESMRLKPIAPLIALQAQVDLDLAGLLVPRGHLLFLMTRLCATSELHHEHAQRFAPQRWLREPGESETDPRRSLFAFGGGPRHCPGRYLAMAEIKMVMSMALAGFDLRLAAPPGGIAELSGLTMVPAALPLQLLARRDAAHPAA